MKQQMANELTIYKPEDVEYLPDLKGWTTESLCRPQRLIASILFRRTLKLDYGDVLAQVTARAGHVSILKL